MNQHQHGFQEKGMIGEMTVSVIIPVYHAVETLEACVTSVLEQSFRPLEILLVDDGSTDGSADLCDRLAMQDDLIHVIHQENRGASEARNRGLQEARGEWVLLLDADDSLLPGALEILLEKKDADAVCGLILRGKQKKHLEPAVLKCGSDMINCVLADPTERLTLHGWIFRRDICGDQRFRSDLSLGEDSEWVLRVLYRCHSAEFIGQPVYHYRICPDSVVHRWKTGKTPSYLKTLEEIAGTPAGSEKNWSLFVLITLLLILTHDTFHPMNPAPVKARMAEARRLRNLPVFQAAFLSADLTALDLDKRIALQWMKAGRIRLVLFAVRLRQHFNLNIRES